MDVNNNYRKLYNDKVLDKARCLIVKYSSEYGKYKYTPFSHKTDKSAVNDLYELIIYNIIFFSYTEKEILESHNRVNILSDMKKAAHFAYRNRLPKRNTPNADGLTGELLLDVLIHAYNPNNRKLIARPIFRQQSDNSEIKGYDSLHFTEDDESISLWLGQVKTGGKYYCKTDMHKDLCEKYQKIYFGDQICFLSDKSSIANGLTELLNEINDINFNEVIPETRNNKIIDLLKSKNVQVKVPCLLFYTENIYADESKLKEEIDKQILDMKNYFCKNEYNILETLNTEIIFYVFPAKDVSEIRKRVVDFKEEGM